MIWGTKLAYHPPKSKLNFCTKNTTAILRQILMRVLKNHSWKTGHHFFLIGFRRDTKNTLPKFKIDYPTWAKLASGFMVNIGKHSIHSIHLGSVMGYLWAIRVCFFMLLLCFFVVSRCINTPACQGGLGVDDFGQMEFSMGKRHNPYRNGQT